MQKERIYASVSESQVIVLTLPFSTVYSQEQVAFLIGQRRQCFQPTSAAGMSFSFIFTLTSQETTTSLWHFQFCLRLNVTLRIFIMSDHFVLVFHMHEVAEALTPMLMNKTRQSKQLRPCIKDESEEFQLRQWRDGPFKATKCIYCK